MLIHAGGERQGKCDKQCFEGWQLDSQSVKYVDNEETGELDLKETFEGQVDIEQVTEQKYLGFVVSSIGNI